MSDFWNYEVKETFGFDGQYVRPSYPNTIPEGTDFVVGICYKDAFPDHLITVDEAYQRALDAKYYLLTIDPINHWDLIGKSGSPLDFLKVYSVSSTH